MIEWDFFLAHAGADGEIAERLYTALEPHCKVYLDSQCLLLGAVWPKEIPGAQRASLMTVVLVSSNTEDARYQMEEIAAAINMARNEEHKHHVIPIYLYRNPEDNFDRPYGLESLHGLFIPDISHIHETAERLLTELRRYKRTSWEHYDWLLDFDGYKVPYIPLLNDCNHTVRQLLLQDVDIRCEGVKYELPKEFIATRLASSFQNNQSCRLSSYNLNENRLSVVLSQTNYEDYLKSGEHLDDPFPSDTTKTFRDSFGSLIRRGKTDLRPFNLTNICGAGVFLISQDNYIVTAHHSSESHVYPGRMTFSASGAMRWGAYPHPFTEILRKCFDETNHQPNPHKLRLIGFGVDARKLYFQFSFYERTEANITDVIDRYPEESRPDRIPFELEPVISHLIDHCWEPAAEAALLTLCVDEFGREKVSNALASHRALWAKRTMTDEWDYRASRAHLLPDMSVRYPSDQLEKGSKRYVEAVMRFIGQDAYHKDVIEVGCGTGRITERLEKKAHSVTCVDLCQRMVLRNQERLGSRAKHISYINRFAQDYHSVRRFDIAVCSLVLIHNVDDSDFHDLVRRLCEYAPVVFVFEDVTENRATSPHTRLRRKEEFERAFAVNGFQEDKGKEKLFQLFDDRIVFLKFCGR